MKQQLTQACSFIDSYLEQNWQDLGFADYMSRDHCTMTVLLIYYFNGRTAVGLDQLFDSCPVSFIASVDRIVCIYNGSMSWVKCSPICLYESIEDDVLNILIHMQQALQRAL